MASQLNAALVARRSHRSARTPERFDPAYAPGQDQTLSRLFGVGVKSYARGPGHMHQGYADPSDPSKRAVNIAAPLYSQLYQLTQPQFRRTVTPREARAAYVFSHEMGHLYAPAHDNETMANNWAASHFKGYLQRMGVPKPQRRQLYRYAHRQGFV